MADLQRTGVALVAEGSQEFTQAMGRARGEVKAFGQDAQKQVSITKQIKNVWTEWNSAIALVERGLGAVRAVYNQTVGAATAYAEVIGSTSRALNIHADQASRVLQVMDDLGVSQGDFTSAARIALSQGVIPNIGGLADVSDHYLSLSSATERAAYAQQTFGRNWMAMTRVLEAGGAALRSMADGVEAGLVLTDEAIRQTERYRLSVDAMSDQWESFTVGMGTRVIPPLTTYLTALNKSMRAFGLYDPRRALAFFAELGAISRAQEAIDQMANLRDHAERLSEDLPRTGAVAGELWLTLNEGRNAGENAAAGLSAPIGPSQALRDALAGANTNLAGLIETFRTNMAWVTGGGLQLQAAAQQVIGAVQRGAITPEQADTLFRPIEAAALGLQEDIGAITMTDAARTMAEDWGGTWSAARTEIGRARDEIATIPEVVRSDILVAVRWQLYGPSGAPGGHGFQHGGAFTVGGPGGTDRSPVHFMATRGERVIVMPPQASPAGPSYSSIDSHDQRSLSVYGQDLSNPFLRNKLLNDWLAGN